MAVPRRRPPQAESHAPWGSRTLFLPRSLKLLAAAALQLRFTAHSAGTRNSQTCPLILTETVEGALSLPTPDSQGALLMGRVATSRRSLHHSQCHPPAHRCWHVGCMCRHPSKVPARTEIEQCDKLCKDAKILENASLGMPNSKAI